MFYGYHATTQEGAEDLLSKGFDERKLGTGAGQLRGPGFYAAATPNGAKSWADKDDELARQADSDGYVVVKVYAPSGLSCEHGAEDRGDCAWGTFPSTDDPNGDGIISAFSNVHDLEVVIRPGAAKKIEFQRYSSTAPPDRVQWPKYQAISKKDETLLLIKAAHDWRAADIDLRDDSNFLDDEDKQEKVNEKKHCEDAMMAITGLSDPHANYKIAQQQRNLRLLEELEKGQLEDSELSTELKSKRKIGG
eukprot:TRINITY_DN51638_c0_g1_i1.p1 TRINITY_DN51638_c0_g1~~TRINITY_DN51638_c0_g1_i1.p1  ORF type:complete len:249 (-),score=62.07 TRINITY_DN51638_c0_g1_i1:27-773(-)